MSSTTIFYDFVNIWNSSKTNFCCRKSKWRENIAWKELIMCAKFCWRRFIVLGYLSNPGGRCFSLKPFNVNSPNNGSSHPMVASQCASRKTRTSPRARLAPSNLALIRPTLTGDRIRRQGTAGLMLKNKFTKYYFCLFSMLSLSVVWIILIIHSDIVICCIWNLSTTVVCGDTCCI